MGMTRLLLFHMTSHRSTRHRRAATTTTLKRNPLTRTSTYILYAKQPSLYHPQLTGVIIDSQPCINIRINYTSSSCSCWQIHLDHAVTEFYIVGILSINSIHLRAIIDNVAASLNSGPTRDAIPLKSHRLRDNECLEL